MTGDHDIPITDSDFLDGLLERALERIEDGESPTAEVLIGERVHLRAAAEELIALARQIAASAPQDAPELPTVPGYTLIRELGHGGMGTVYLARQEALGGRPVALKFLAGSASFSAQARERLLGEAKAIARLQHPNIVAVYDVVKAGPMVAYAMELVDGPSLAQLIERGGHPEIGAPRDQGRVARIPHGDPSRAVPSPVRAEDGPALNVRDRSQATDPHLPTVGPSAPGFLDPSGVCRIAIAIARALGEVHRAGLLHRDVKPSNILLRRDGTPLLSDFGLAKTTHDSPLTTHSPTLTLGFVGTPAYAAPEQLRGEGAALDARTDVYALGVTLYHALTLKMPFGGRSSADVLRRIETGRAEPLRKADPRLPRDLETIVATAMDPDPARRYATADELADDLDRLLNLQPIRARPAGLVTRGFKLVRRNRRALAAGTVGGIAALAFAIALGAYLFMVPGWVADHLAEARLALLNPAHREAIFVGLHLPDDARGRSNLSPEMAAAMRESLQRYRLALRWAALRPQAGRIRLERDTVALATELLARQAGHGIPEPSAALRQSAPHTCEAAAAWSGPEIDSGLSEERLAGAGPEDLRCLGLLAFLTGRAEWCNRAWSQGGFDLTDDPLVDASLGQLYLELDQPALALPRLEQAFRAFPQAGFLCVDLASAAVGVGDLPLAHRRLEQAETLGRRDTFNTLKRVWADHYAARAAAQPGESGEADAARARELYEWVARRHKAPTAKYNYAVFLEARGEPREGLAVLGRMSPSRLTIRKYSEAFVTMADRWWSGRSVGERWKLVRGALDENPFDPNSFVGLLRTYMECRVRIADQAGPPGVIDAPSPSNGEGDRRPGGTLENSPAFQGWEHDGQTNPSPVGTTEIHSAVPTGLDSERARSPSDESLGYFHTVPPARPGFRLVDFSIFRLFSAALSHPVSSSFLQRVTLTRLAEVMEVSDMTRWSKIMGWPAWTKNLQAAVWLTSSGKVASIGLNYLDRLRRLCTRICLGVLGAGAAVGLAQAQTIDFETLPNGTPTSDNMVISNQYEAVFGVEFTLLNPDTGQFAAYPRIAKVGSPQTAFSGCTGDDTPCPGQGLGQSFLTDDGVPGGPFYDLLITYSTPVAQASGVIIDVDCRNLGLGPCEQWTILARDSAGNSLEQRVITGTAGSSNQICGGITCTQGQGGPDDSRAQLWSFDRASADIVSIRIHHTGTGVPSAPVAFDNFSPASLGCTGGPDCNSNGAADNCDIAEGTSEDANTDGIPDECEPGVPAAMMANAVSRKTCDLSLMPSLASESRQGGVTELRIAFDTPPGGPGLDPVTLEVATCAAPAFVPYSGTSTIGAAVTGSELILTFTPGLENGRTYRVNIGAEVTSIPNQSVEFRGLLGDANGDGQVNATDRSAVVGAWTGSGFTCATDANNDGQTNATDRSIVVGAWTSPQNCAP